jgi:hypothetical protein
MYNLREGGTMSSVERTLRDVLGVALTHVVSPSCTTNAMRLQDFPNPIESASMPPLNCTGL